MRKEETGLSFDDINISDNVLRGIYSYGLRKIHQCIQYKSIPIIKEGKDVIAQAQSGTGKTGAFVIGCLENINVDNKETQIVIISPNFSTN